MPSALQIDGTTAVTKALLNWHNDVVQLLLTYRPDLNIQDNVSVMISRFCNDIVLLHERIEISRCCIFQPKLILL